MRPEAFSSSFGMTRLRSMLDKYDSFGKMMLTRFRHFFVFILFLPCSWYRSKIMYSLQALCIVILRFWKKIKLVTKFNQNRTVQKKFSEPKMSNFSEKTGTFFSERHNSKLAAEFPEKIVYQKRFCFDIWIFRRNLILWQTAFHLCCKNKFLANLVGVKYSSASGRLVNVRFWKKNWT